MRNHRGQAPPQVQSTLAKLSLCRTAALGGHLYECSSCDHRTVVYNSCGDRHCPQCAGAKRSNWLDSTARLLLPGVDYFQVVFTIPDKLSSLTLGNRREMFNLLFRSAWRALKHTVENEQQFEAAAAMVLHTWNQKLDAHIHVHALVPGGGPSLTNANEWKTSRPPVDKNQNRLWLVDADELRLAFRTQFLNGLRRLHAAGELKLTGDWEHLRNEDAFDAWLKPMKEIDWVTYIQPPPSHDSRPEHVLKYLACYMTGGPISDRRVISHENGVVKFTARAGTTHGGSDEVEEIEVPGAEFVRRWSLHILPKGFTKTRRFGGFSNYHCKRYMSDCRRLLSLEAPTDPPTNSEQPVDECDESVECETSKSSPRCPHCATEMLCVAGRGSPGWSIVMTSRFRPRWYADG